MSSKYYGVTTRLTRGGTKYVAQMSGKGGYWYGGTYDTEQEAREVVECELKKRGITKIPEKKEKRKTAQENGKNYIAITKKNGIFQAFHRYTDPKQPPKSARQEVLIFIATTTTQASTRAAEYIKQRADYTVRDGFEFV